MTQELKFKCPYCAGTVLNVHVSMDSAVVISPRIIAHENRLESDYHEAIKKYEKEDITTHYYECEKCQSAWDSLYYMATESALLNEAGIPIDLYGNPRHK